MTFIMPRAETLPTQPTTTQHDDDCYEQWQRWEEKAAKSKSSHSLWDNKVDPRIERHMTLSTTSAINDNGMSKLLRSNNAVASKKSEPSMYNKHCHSFQCSAKTRLEETKRSETRNSLLDDDDVDCIALSHMTLEQPYFHRGVVGKANLQHHHWSPSSPLSSTTTTKTKTDPLSLEKLMLSGAPPLTTRTNDLVAIASTVELSRSHCPPPPQAPSLVRYGHRFTNSRLDDDSDDDDDDYNDYNLTAMVNVQRQQPLMPLPTFARTERVFL